MKYQAGTRVRLKGFEVVGEIIRGYYSMQGSGPELELYDVTWEGERPFTTRALLAEWLDYALLPPV